MNTQTLNNILTYTLTAGLRIILIVFFAFLLNLVSNFLINKITERIIKKTNKKKTLKTLKNVFSGTAKFIILLISLLMILSEIRMKKTPHLASVGVLGLAVSMGAKEIVADFLAGIFILIDDLYSIGDKVTILGFKGEVKDIDLRKTTIKGLDGQIYIIPNGKIKEIEKDD
jgi:small conductance mechanosensitive channel